jgi:mono/diheme cytochrome c family protein
VASYPENLGGTVIALVEVWMRSGEYQAAVRNQEEGNGIMKVNQLNKVGIAAFAASMVMSIGLLATPAWSANDGDAAATFKTKCVACHGAAAEKKFDATLPEAEMVKIILTGKKPEKPPNMPAYGEKGVTEDQAKALAGYMKSLKQ